MNLPDPCYCNDCIGVTPRMTAQQPRYLSDNGAFRGTPTRPNLRPFDGGWWAQQVVGKETPRGPRYHGVVSNRFGTIVYTTRWYARADTAHEVSRARAVHHNLYHDGSESAARVAHLHSTRYCHE